MTSKPELRLGRHLLPGLAAVALFVVLAFVFLNAQFAEAAAGFAADASITEGIGYALFNIATEDTVPSEGFLAAFEIIDIVLIAALAGAVMLARREVDGVVTDALATDGGSETDGSQDEEGGDR